MRNGRRRVRRFENLETRAMLTVLGIGEAVFPSPRSIINYGSAVELNGDRAFVGDDGEDAMFVMLRVGQRWTTEAVLEPDGQLDFPTEIAADGDLVVASSVDSSDDDRTLFRTHVFERIADVWHETATLTCGDGRLGLLSVSAAQDAFSCGDVGFFRSEAGQWVREPFPDIGIVSGNRLVTVNLARSRVLHRTDAGAWTEQQILDFPAVAADIEGNTLVLGTRAGDVVVYEDDGTGWRVAAQFPFDAIEVEVEGDVIAAASQRETIVYDRADGVWRLRGTFETPMFKPTDVAIEAGNVLINGEGTAHFLVPVFQVEGVIWNDVDTNGLRDDDLESRVSGVRVQLIDGDGQLIAESITDVDGRYVLKAHSADSTRLQVRLVTPQGTKLTHRITGDADFGSDFDPSTGLALIRTTSLTAVVDGGIVGTGRRVEVRGTVWSDDGDGRREDGIERRLPSIKVSLANAQGWTIAETLTDINGEYGFVDLVPGVYSVGFAVSANQDTVRLTLMDSGESDTIDSDVHRATRRSEAVQLVERQVVEFDAGFLDVVYPNLESVVVTEIKSRSGEYIELTNVGSQFALLDTLMIRGAIDYEFAAGAVRDLAPGESVVVVGPFGFPVGVDPAVVAGRYRRQLGAAERIDLVSTNGLQVFQSFAYDRHWFGSENEFQNMARSINVFDPVNGDFNDPANWYLNADPIGTPGWHRPPTAFVPGSIVINELMASSNEEGDWIELKNTTDATIDIGHWFLGDTTLEYAAPRRFQFAAGITIAPHGFLLLREEETFGNAAHPSTGRPFGLSRNGESLYLSAGDEAGNLLGVVDAVDFERSLPQLTFGRHEVETGTELAHEAFSMLSTPTPGSANSAAFVSSLVINEIMYAPGFLGDRFLELKNVSNEPVVFGQPTSISLKMDNSPVFWSREYTIQAGGLALIVELDADSFRAKHRVPSDVVIIELTQGESIPLPSDGQEVSLQTWDAASRAFAIDAVRFSSERPWPDLTRRAGASIERTDAIAYGSEISNWHVSRFIGGTPGRENSRASETPEIDAVCSRLGDTVDYLGQWPDLYADWVISYDDVLRVAEGQGAVGPGDANLDGVFDSSDIVSIFQRGLYARNESRASWAEGDWNCDGLFNSTDLVFALSQSRYRFA